ncbi:hypothetical protein [Pseudomonas sp. EYE_354]|uniref:hypothetical protein n=1 Tax=Pseudomonas sp. EYE_354 TaxID=2853449 RepID=UPI002004E1E9|nr:hypothetical protein [Pseudomonas sp. EYE_354]
MSSYSINNIARIVNVSHVLNAGPLAASNETCATLSSEARDASSSVAYRSTAEGAGKASGMAGVSALIALFTSFFTRLLGLVSPETDPAMPDSAPSPAVTPAPVPNAPVPGQAVDIPGLSGKRRGEKPASIWSGFRQGPDGNCVTVSAIKAAMYRFGQSPTDIFKQVHTMGNDYHVVMRDGFQLTLSAHELAEGARGARFYGPDKGMLKDARFLFAVSAKRAQMENNDRTAGRSYAAAIRSLNDGEDEYGPGEGFVRLGLRQHMKRVSVGQLARGQLGMCNRTGHSVAVINGREELWGNRGPVPTRGDAVALI